MALRILTWAFPWLMAVLEFLLRISLHAADATTFIGPTVGGAVLGTMLPFTRAREIPPITPTSSKAKTARGPPWYCPRTCLSPNEQKSWPKPTNASASSRNPDI